MKEPFHDPIAVKEKKANRTFVAPTKEQATTGSFMSPGDDYGIGHRTPVGSMRARPMASGVIPQESKCFDPNEII